MLDIRLLREDPHGVLTRLRRRDPDVELDSVLSLDHERRQLISKVQELRERRNQGSQQVARLKAAGDHEAATERIAGLGRLAEEIKEVERRLAAVEEELHARLLELPNLPHDSVPVGTKEEKVLVRQWGEPPQPPPPVQNHLELARRLGLLDMERGARITGARFPLYTGVGARLELALIRWMFEFHVARFGYRPVLPPILANRASFVVSGQLPKFADELYHVPAEDLFLNPTAESLLVNLHREEILAERELPLRYVAYTPCFRREAGSYGEEQRGLIRVHQFNKVELFHYTTPARSYADLEELVGHAEAVLQALGIHYRVMLLPTQDLAQQSAKTVDLEVWLPAQGRYYEVSSCSNCEDYQARRGAIRYRPSGGGRPQLVHTLNGSGLATSRLLAALLEQNQRPDGSVALPPVVAELMGTAELR
ncbi:MAG: serine--tRNA ligase [Candidatus Bipolaricaulaceae bacterium]